MPPACTQKDMVRKKFKDNACPMFAQKGPTIQVCERPTLLEEARNYPAAFPLKHQQKDLRLALEL
eukprot:scaffold40790_cov18-Tisochrysis_lutea.AAC.1